MKTTLFKYAALFTVLFLCFTKAYSQSLPIASYGVWDRGGQITNFADPNVDFVMGIEASAKWESIELVKGTFDFSSLQTAIDKAATNNKLIRLSVEAGPDAPLWMYDNDTNANNNPYPQVQKVYTNDGNDKPAWPFYPEYLSTTYQGYFWTFLQRFSDFIRNQPQEKFAKIAFVQVKTGCTGDEVPYKGLNPTVVITDQQWHDFRLTVFAKYKEYFNDVPNKKVVLTFNDVDPSDPNEIYAWRWATTNIDPAVGFGIKGGAFNRGHHLSDEQSYKNSLYNYLVNPTGLKLFSGSEMDGTTQNTYFQICEDMSYYWAALGGINVGLSTNNLNAVAMNYATTNPIGRETFRMFTKYAQQVYPATSTTAFSIFHDGLNAADATRFPEGTYGPKRMDNQARYTAICNDPVYASRGAKMDDVFSATKGQVYQRASQTGLNDAGWNIAEGNIERFITQIDPNNTSIGLFRVRGAITASSSKYDRFARSFECKTNKNKMFFQVHSEFPANNKVLKFTVIWLDRNIGGTWAFQYRNASGLQSRSFTGTGGDIWKTETFTLSDAIINQGGERGSDFMLVNTDGNNQTGKQFDDIFNGIEMNIIGSKQAQTINFNAIPDKKVGDPDFSPGATTNSGLTISYASSNEQVANFVNGKIHLVGIGSTTITASQAGNNTYESASVSQELRVAMVNQTTITTAGTSTWTSPAGVKKITVECWGAGGGGGGAWAQCVGGGGAGGSYVANTLAVTPLTSYGLTVGAGAGQATGTGTNGLAGGNTRFEWTTPLIANGGVGGFGSGVPSPVVPRAGAGGANVTGGSGGTITLGSSGAAGAVGTSIYGGSGGSGGNSVNSGAAAKTTVGAGNRATIAGGGGSGAYGPASPLTTGNNRGGTAAAGQVTISYILSVPDAPIIGNATATGLSGTASISFTVPAFDGNATITSYTATASPGGRTSTISQSGSGSITITGLTNGTAYTFTVRATNSVGQSASSTPSNAATPVRTSQTIAFNAIPTKTFGDADSNAGAIASSGLAVYYDSSNVDVVRVENGLIQVIGVGTASITAYQDGDETYAPAIPVTIQLTVIKANQSISFNALPIKTFGDADFGLGAAASSGLAVTYTSSDETVAKTINGTINIVGAGTCTISATQLGNTSYNAAATIPQTLTVSKANQSISFNALPTKTFGDADFSAGATASSGLPVTYSSSDETIAKIVNGAIQILGAGTVSITASQAGNTNFNPATSVSNTLTVGRANQSISYTALPNKTFGDADFSAGAIASSGLTVTYASSDETVATIINGSIRIVGTGTSSITALQVGNLNFNPATAVSQQFIVAKANQTITFSPLTARSKIGDIDFSPGATISSGLAISYRSSNENIATIVNGNIHIIGGGTCEITSSQAGNSNFNPALDVTNTLTVDWVGIKSPINGASFTVGNSVALEAEGLAKAGIDAMRFRIDGGAYTNVSTAPYILNVPGLTVGSHTIELQMKDLLNNRISATTITITIIKANQNISFNQLPNKTFGDADFTPAATASSGLPVTYTSSDNLVAAIVNGAIQIVGVGNAIITASQDGNGTYNAATSASQLLTVIKANQNISFNALPTKTFGDAAFNAGATTNSGLVVAFSSSNNLVATVVNGAIDIVGVGTAIITASQTGNGNYNPANSVSQQLTVVKANQNISFNALPTKTFGDADFSAGAAASSGLAISYTSSDNLVAAIINGAIRIVGVGTATITASQAGDVNYNAAPSVAQVITVSKANQTITFNALPSKIFGDADFSLAATASSGLIISYTSSNQAVATIVNGVVRIVSAGNCTITASQAGNSSYNVATSITQVLKILTVVRTVIATVGNSTWTCPTGVTSIKVEAWGGGGSGGSSSTGGLGGGGAGGSFVANAAVSVVPGSSYALTVGAGGIPSSNGSTNGTAGGSTTFASSTPVIANGGAFGNKAVGTGTLNTAFGLGGTNTSAGSGGTTYVLGTNGSNAAFGNSGAGGNGTFSGGAGGATKTSSGVGLPGAVPGGGGSGSFAALSGGRAGGAGGAGQIVITYNAEVANPGGRFKPTTNDNTVVSDKSKQFKIYPNPVAAYSEFEYNLLEEGKVQLSIFALNGQVIKTLINNQTHLPGSYTKVFEGCDFPDGVYIAQLKIGNEIKNIKVVVKK